MNKSSEELRERHSRCLVRVLQRNHASKIHRDTWKEEIYYRNWLTCLRRPSLQAKLENCESQWYHSVWVQNLRTKAEEVRGSKSSRKSELASLTFLFYSVLQWIGWGPPPLKKAICLTPHANSNAILFLKHPPQTCPEIMFYPLPWHPLVQLSQYIKNTRGKGHNAKS